MSEEPYYDAESKRSAGFEKHVTSRSTWLRLVFMILFALISSVARVVIGLVVFVQFLHVLFTGETNRRLLELGHSLAAYFYEITAYLTYNTDVRPFPLDAPWPPPAPPVLHPPIVAPPPPSPPPSSASPPSPTSPPPPPPPFTSPPPESTPPAASEIPPESSSPSSSPSSSESSQTSRTSQSSPPSPGPSSSSTGDPPL